MFNRTAACLPHAVAKRQAGKLYITILIVFDLTRPEIGPEIAILVADALSTRILL